MRFGETEQCGNRRYVKKVTEDRLGETEEIGKRIIVLDTSVRGVVY